MSSERRRGEPGSDVVLERLAHAFTPAEWSGPALVAGIVALVVVAAVIVAQRALLADDVVGWTITGVHAAVVAVVVPLLVRRTVREWRAVRADQPAAGVPE